MDIIERALLVAEKAHSTQSYGIFPYIYHVKAVVDVAQILGFKGQIVIACVLHDVLEDTELSFNDIKITFGAEVAEIVYCVTDELGRNREERKTKTYPKIKGNWKAVAVKLCDRIANMKHSSIYNEKIFKMYVAEHDMFCNSIKNSEHPKLLNRAWDALNSIVDGK